MPYPLLPIRLSPESFKSTRLYIKPPSLLIRCKISKKNTYTQEMILFFLHIHFFFRTFAKDFNFSMEQGLNTYYYRVAEHLFAVECADNSLFERMINYEPFRVETHGTTIFTLRIEPNGLLRDEQRASYKHIFTDNSEEDMPRIEVYRSDKTPAEAMGREGDRAPQNATSVFGDPDEAMRREGDWRLAKGADGWVMRVSQIAQ